MKRLNPAQVLGITGTENPLTPADRVAVARRIYSPVAAAAILTGNPARARRDQSGGGHGLAYYCERRGVWASIGCPPCRAGLIRWPDLEDVLLRRATPEITRRLVAADTAYRRDPEPPLTAADASRLMADARAALAELLTPPAQSVQLDLFSEVS